MLLHNRTKEGDMFIVKDPDLFATIVIPQYFDHNKFSSFARQLNFYGFRKMQAKPIRNSDFNAETAKHVTFYNEKFKRGRCELLKEIQRSTRGGNAGLSVEKEVQLLKDQVHELQNQLEEMNSTMEDRMRRLELDMLNRMEQMMSAMQQCQSTPNGMMHQQSVGTITSNLSQSHNTNMLNQHMHDNVVWNPLPLDNSKGVMRMTSLAGSVTGIIGGSMGGVPMVSEDSISNTPKLQAPATLPPHPKQKLLPPNGLPSALNQPPDRLNSLMTRNLSRGVSNLSVDSSASAVLLRNSWEDKFFSMLMLGENEANAQQQAQAQAQQHIIGMMNAGGQFSESDMNSVQTGNTGNSGMGGTPLLGINHDGSDRLSSTGSVQHTHEL